MPKLVPAHVISNCYQCIEYKSMPGTDDQLMYCRKMKRETNMQDICDRNMWEYEITGLGIKYMKCMVQLICEVNI